MAEKKTINYVVGDRYRMERNTVVVMSLEHASPEAQLAFGLIERWGMVAAMPDGEDSSGRQKLRLAVPEELVSRAFTTARLAYQAARDNGLMTDLPDMQEIYDKSIQNPKDDL